MKMNHAVLTAVSVFTLIGANSIHAEPSDLDKYFTISSVTTEEVSHEYGEPVLNSGAIDGPVIGVPNPTPTPPAPGTPGKPPAPVPVPVPGAGGIDIGEIIRIGSEIWKIIEKNAPVVDQKFEPISLIPQGIKSWEQLSMWAMPETRVFKKSYKNAYGMTVAEFNYRVAYTHGGTVDGKGRFLSRVEIEPATLNVAWGYKFSAQGEVVNPTNAGTTADPIAAMELRVNWKVSTVMRHMQSSDRYYVRGDGVFKDLSAGTATAVAE